MLFVVATISGVSLLAFADKDVCDTVILNRPGCEVGDFDRTGGPLQTKIIDERFPGRFPVKGMGAPLPKSNNAAILQSARLLQLKQYEMAIAVLKAAIAADPSDASCPSELSQVYVQYGDDMRERKDLKGAIEQYQSALKVFPPCAEARSRLKELNVGTK